MTRIEVFGHLVRHSLDVAIALWPLSLILLLVALIALLVGQPFRQPQFRQRLRIILSTYLFPFAIMSVGAIFRYDWIANPKWVEPPDWYGEVLWTVLAAHAGTALAIAISSKVERMRSIAMLLPGLWFSLSSGFMAGIAIAGVGP